jgi:hypothetical protein
MTDDMTRLLAVEVLPCGERLARWLEANATAWEPPAPRTWWVLLGNSRIPDIPGPLRRYALDLRIAMEERAKRRNGGAR